MMSARRSFGGAVRAGSVSVSVAVFVVAVAVLQTVTWRCTGALAALLLGVALLLAAALSLALPPSEFNGGKVCEIVAFVAGSGAMACTTVSGKAWNSEDSSSLLTSDGASGVG